MRSFEEVMLKYQELRKRRLSQRREKAFSREGRNCAYNVRMRVKGHGKCGFCRNQKVVPEDGRPFVCDEEGTARRCRFFENRHTLETVEEDFEEILRNPARCGEAYPKLAILIWFLQEDSRRDRIQRLRLSAVELFRSFCALFFWRWW